MAVEPWINYADPAYWRELIGKDIDLAKTVLKSKKYHLVALKCHEATEKILCCWFVEHYPDDKLSKVDDLTSFSQKIGVSNELTSEMTQLLESLDEHKTTSPLREEFTQEDCEVILEKTEEFYEFLTSWQPYKR